MNRKQFLLAIVATAAVAGVSYAEVKVGEPKFLIQMKDMNNDHTVTMICAQVTNEQTASFTPSTPQFK